MIWYNFLNKNVGGFLVDLTKGASIIKKHLDGYELNISMYGHALRYVIYYLASSFESGVEITEEHLVEVCKDAVEMAEKL